MYVCLASFVSYLCPNFYVCEAKPSFLPQILGLFYIDCVCVCVCVCFEHANLNVCVCVFHFDSLWKYLHVCEKL